MCSDQDTISVVIQTRTVFKSVHSNTITKYHRIPYMCLDTGYNKKPDHFEFAIWHSGLQSWLHIRNI